MEKMCSFLVSPTLGVSSFIPQTTTYLKTESQANSVQKLTTIPGVAIKKNGELSYSHAQTYRNLSPPMR